MEKVSSPLLMVSPTKVSGNTISLLLTRCSEMQASTKAFKRISNVYLLVMNTLVTGAKALPTVKVSCASKMATLSRAPSSIGCVKALVK